MAWDKLDSARIEQIIRQITGKKLDKSTEMVAPAIIRLGIIYLWAPTKKTLKSKQIYQSLVSRNDEKDRILIYDGYNLLAIHPDDLEEIDLTK